MKRPPPTPSWLAERATEHDHPEWIENNATFEALFIYVLDAIADLKKDLEELDL